MQQICKIFLNEIIVCTFIYQYVSTVTMHGTKWTSCIQKGGSYGTLQSRQSMQNGDAKLQTAETDCSVLIVSVSDRQWGTESVTALFLTPDWIFQNLSVLVLFLVALQLLFKIWQLSPWLIYCWTPAHFRYFHNN